MPYEGLRLNFNLDRFEASSRWLRDLQLYSRVGLRYPCGTVIVMVVQTGKIEIEASLWYPSAVLVMPVIDMPCDNCCCHRGARCFTRHAKSWNCLSRFDTQFFLSSSSSRDTCIRYADPNSHGNVIDQLRAESGRIHLVNCLTNNF